MTTTHLTIPVRRVLLRVPRQIIRHAWAFSPILTASILAHLVLIPIFAVAAIVDPDIITGAPAWIMPLKFAISIAIYTGTFIWLLTFVQGRRKLVQMIAAITGIGSGSR